LNKLESPCSMEIPCQIPPRAVTFSWWGDCVPQWSR